MGRNLGSVAAGALLALVVAASGELSAGAEARDDAPGALDTELLSSIQGLLAVKRLDGWLLAGEGERNPIARELVRPEGSAETRWFYYIPAAGEPVAIAAESDVSRFAAAPGRAIGYASAGELEELVADELAGAERVAVEHDPELPGAMHVAEPTLELVRSAGAELRSSADLVQHTVAQWRPRGRIAHYLAVHHLIALRDRAFELVAQRLQAGEVITERDVQRAIEDGYELRGLEGPAPRVATGANTGDPEYRPTEASSSPIRRGDLLLVDLAARVEDARRPIYADLSWVATVGDEVPARHRELFAAAADARDAAISLVRERVEAGETVRGYEVDRAARDAAEDAGYGEAFAHRSGHSLAATLPGPGTHLDDGDVRDTRSLVQGTGFAIGPGLYLGDELGVRVQVGAHIAGRRLEITSPIQQHVTPILSR